MDSLFCPTHGWPIWLGGFGVAFQMRADDRINALGGDQAWVCDDSEVLRLLSGGLLLDGPAASILQERGYGRFLGLDEIKAISQSDRLYSIEELTDSRFTNRVGALIDINDKPCTQKLFQGRLQPQAEMISVLRDPQFCEVGHGVVIFENSLGGRVAICPWDVNAPDVFSGQRTIYRAVQMQTLVNYLGKESSPGCVSGAPWLVSQFFGDEQRWRGVIWNAHPDAVDEFEVTLPEGMKEIHQAIHINAEGKRRPAKIDQRKIKLDIPLQQWECVILLDGSA